MKKVKRVLAYVLGILLALSCIPNIPAEAAEYVPTIVMHKKGETFVLFDGVELGENDPVPTVKVSNKNIAEVYTVKKEEDEDERLNLSGAAGTYYHKWHVYVTIILKKAGRTTFSFYLNGREYKKTIKIVNYKNPVKSITIKGLNKGKNLASKFNKKNTAKLKAVKAKNSIIKVVPRNGWRTVCYEIKEYNKKEKNPEKYINSISLGNREETDFELGENSKIDKTSMRIGNLSKSKKYIVTILMSNKKTLKKVEVTFTIGG